MLDKTSPSLKQIEDGVAWAMAQLDQEEILYIHCSAGHELSATFAAALLLAMGECKNVEDAIKLL